MKILPDFLDINGSSPICVKSSENPIELILRSVQVPHIVCLNFVFQGWILYFQDELCICNLDFVFPGWSCDLHKLVEVELAAWILVEDTKESISKETSLYAGNWSDYLDLVDTSM